MLKHLPLLILALALSACSYAKKQTVVGDQANAYRSATPAQPLLTPANLPQNKIGSETETLPNNVQAKSLTSIPLPPGSLANQVATGQVPKTVLNQKVLD